MFAPNNICAGKSSVQTSCIILTWPACGSHVVTCAIGGRYGVSLWELEIADWGQRLGIADQFAKTGGQRLCS